MMQPKSRVKIVSEETLSNGWTRLSSYLLDYIDRKGATQGLKREIYHRTPAACILLYDPKRDLVVLVRQFRLAVHLNGDPAWMIEVPAGLLDDDHPEAAIRREAMEETGYRLRDARFLFKSYTSPGAITEVVHFFAALIDTADRVAEGGGLDEEHEDIEVLETPLDEAAAMIETGEIFDAKTIVLLQWALLNRGKLR
ncbi:NUDIX domain-containing protein [Rhizobium leguminosarum]|jgi:ADP-ribose pyrophosphatase|uniref:GDP-mannose pyrophosphatase n=1 Tax=Rhizobium leguminosarum TaxID=384 RepID=A0A444IKX5_RHILE|nr:NUDIX domain-containing protein [Rhizobium leguminosarum]MDH6659612.1 ADP-ribose pyrophosphatase [Rhizobium sophorae]ASS53578.1 ADP-ribose pyrophosphatase [Rhizobium leguminosarum bv. viciae]AVC49207.1 nudix-type nucleoside diphosphatase, YffH/AdpP family protein [Rhizobium leguminosarum bv. viciae]MBA9036323.1 ADP-ribose pyrophosphatase [Rhizobium leguminosarum]MBB4327341.1 ADP-ribose pyrophosphatase [Rhizobium leguminosarum]